jgi:hypothetical protein
MCLTAYPVSLEPSVQQAAATSAPLWLGTWTCSTELAAAQSRVTTAEAVLGSRQQVDRDRRNERHRRNERSGVTSIRRRSRHRLFSGGSAFRDLRPHAGLRARCADRAREHFAREPARTVTMPYALEGYEMPLNAGPTRSAAHRSPTVPGPCQARRYKSLKASMASMIDACWASSRRHWMKARGQFTETTAHRRRASACSRSVRPSR